MTQHLGKLRRRYFPLVQVVAPEIGVGVARRDVQPPAGFEGSSHVGKRAFPVAHVLQDFNHHRRIVVTAKRLRQVEHVALQPSAVAKRINELGKLDSLGVQFDAGHTLGASSQLQHTRARAEANFQHPLSFHQSAEGMIDVPLRSKHVPESPPKNVVGDVTHVNAISSGRYSRPL